MIESAVAAIGQTLFAILVVAFAVVVAVVVLRMAASPSREDAERQRLERLTPFQRDQEEGQRTHGDR